MSSLKEMFKVPPASYKMKTIIHGWPRNPEVLADAILDFGYGGTATNPSFKNGYTANWDNLREFGELTKLLQDKGLEYWIYDENGYPSGYAGGQTLSGHPEFEAKGFYMVRRVAYQDRHVVFDLDDESDKIIWAAKYPLDCTVLNASVVQYDKMVPVLFSEIHCECDLKEREALFVFCVKSAYEGTHCVHNVCSHSRYINIMDRDAVKRFLDINYEPIVQAVPNAYENAEAVFTDEPSLMAGYMHGDETWPYALAPWTEGMFEAFEKAYGFSLLPYLPMIFEGRSNAYSIRIYFYNLVGKLVAEAYVKQISNWCKEHGSKFSGHYLAEESLQAHVIYYGSYLEVLKSTDYPGVDILASYPEIYNYNTPKFAQMAARKSGAGGVMVELCPFINLSHFEKNPVVYAKGILNLMFLGGCRTVNSYFSSDFAEYDTQELHEYRGYISKRQSIELNDYVGRVLTVLDGACDQCDTFVYYAIEEAQAKTIPSHCAITAENSVVDCSINSITAKISELGIDYQFCDKEDLLLAGKHVKSKGARISDMPVKNIIIPTMDIIYEESYRALELLQKYGVKVWFLDKLPAFRAETMVPFSYYDFREEAVLKQTIKSDGIFKAKSEKDVLKCLAEAEQEFCLETLEISPAKILKAKYQKNHTPFYFSVNNSEKEMDVKWYWRGEEVVQVWDPEDGRIRLYKKGEKVKIKAYQGLFFFSGQNII